MFALPVTHVCVRTFGVVVPLHVRGEALAAAVVHAWQDQVVAGAEDGETALPPLNVSIGAWGTADVVGSDPDEVLHTLDQALTDAVANARSTEIVVLRAASLAAPDTGATAVLVATPGTGLTTLARTLGTSWAVLTDETTGIAPDGSVVPLAKPLSVAGHRHVKEQVPLSTSGLLTATAPGHLAALVVLHRDPQHDGEPVMEPLETVDALAALAPRARFLNNLERPLHALAEVVAHAGGVRSVTYGEADSLGPVLHSIVGDGAP